jgi:nitroimidazol reductase NimA-like FMN-containing flavoprotein (pyridoxamine 5'-phosphate oxidase superfamily)
MIDYMIDSKNFDWKKYLSECLNSTDYCCIATVDGKGVWSNPVYFAWDNNFVFYFISQMNSRHMQNLDKNQRIAFSVYKTEQKDNVVGIQIEGMAKILSPKDSKEEIQHAYDTYYGRAGSGPDVQGYINNPTWLYVKIIPEKIYYFDTRFFEEERQEVPISKLL